jgi:hypothetical protein
MEKMYLIVLSDKTDAISVGGTYTEDEVLYKLRGPVGFLSLDKKREHICETVKQHSKKVQIKKRAISVEKLTREIFGCNKTPEIDHAVANEVEEMQDHGYYEVEGYDVDLYDKDDKVVMKCYIPRSQYEALCEDVYEKTCVCKMEKLHDLQIADDFICFPTDGHGYCDDKRAIEDALKKSTVDGEVARALMENWQDGRTVATLCYDGRI